MELENYLDGYVYHMTHFDNLHSIIQQKALLSQEMLSKKGLVAFSIANEEVQRLRKRIYVWDIVEESFRPLHSYIPFYFAKETPMFRNQQDRGIQNKIVTFEVHRNFLGDQRVLFTDGNASIQQLSKSVGEKVHIIPATVANDKCKRKYLPDGYPHGTNNSHSDFYNDTKFLNRLAWDVIYRRNYIEFDEYKRVVQAEALFPDLFPLDEVSKILVTTNDMRIKVQTLFDNLCSVEDRLPIECR